LQIENWANAKVKLSSFGLLEILEHDSATTDPSEAGTFEFSVKFSY
jgi:hypothetical protein